MPKRATTTPLEETIRANIKRVIDARFQGKVGQVARKHKNVTLSRLQEFLDGNGATLAKLQPWADALEVKPYHLLIKDLDINDLPELVSAKRLRRIEQLRKELNEDVSETHGQRTKGNRDA